MINMNNPVAMAQEIAQLRAINDDLLAALADLLKHVSDAGMSEADIARHHNAIFAKSVAQARAAIAKAEKAS